MITGLNHTGLVVQDIEKQVAFYRDVIGLRVVRDKEVVAPETGDHTGFPDVHRRLVFLGSDNGEHMLELIYYFNPPSPVGHQLEHHQVNSVHICFNVNNLDDIYIDLSEKGVRFFTPPKVINRPVGGRVGICYAQDPEGNWLEFIEEFNEETT